MTDAVVALLASIINTAIHSGQMEQPVEVWITGSDGGLLGGFIGEDGTPQVHFESAEPPRSPFRIFCFSESGAVKQLVFENCGWEESFYERAS